MELVGVGWEDVNGIYAVSKAQIKSDRALKDVDRYWILDFLLAVRVELVAPSRPLFPFAGQRSKSDVSSRLRLPRPDHVEIGWLIAEVVRGARFVQLQTFDAGSSWAMSGVKTIGDSAGSTKSSRPAPLPFCRTRRCENCRSAPPSPSPFPLHTRWIIADTG